MYPKLTTYQKEMIDSFQPSKFYKWFYKIWSKLLSKIIWILLIICFPLGFLQNYIPLFMIIKIIFFICGGLGLFALFANLNKHFYTIRYAKKIGLTLKQWNYWTIGKTFKN